jgi:ankyrin repeat protein
MVQISALKVVLALSFIHIIDCVDLDYDGQTVLDLAASKGWIDIVDCLSQLSRKMGVHINIEGEKFGCNNFTVQHSEYELRLGCLDHPS